MDHEGECRFLHGHSYQCKILISSSYIPEDGMIIDLGMIESYIKNKFDHCLLLNRNDLLSEAIDMTQAKIRVFDKDPTIETLAEKIARDINEMLIGIDYITVVLSETQNNRVKFTFFSEVDDIPN